VVLSLAGKDQSLNEKAAEIAGIIERLGVDAILDDRAERPGVKFKDADLVGYPMQVVVGGKGLERGVVEVKNRKTGEKSELPLDGFEAAFAQWRTSVHEDWRLSG
jgi:prolyl-tRNA synthetase